jgi:hypothetical protein
VVVDDRARQIEEPGADRDWHHAVEARRELEGAANRRAPPTLSF